MSRDNDRWLTDLREDGEAREAALSELRTALLRNLRQALSRYSVDDAFLEDAVQDTLLRILDRLGQFQGRSRFLTWATSIAIRVALGELRRGRWKDVSLEGVLATAGFVPDQIVDRESPPQAQAERRALLHTLQQLIEHELTERQKTALLAELKGMPQDEIARHLGSNRNALYKLTHDARKRLKRGLETAGYAAEDVVATLPR